MRHKFISAFLAFVLFLLVVGIVNFKPPVTAGVVPAAADGRTTAETATTTTTTTTTTTDAPTPETTATQEPTSPSAPELSVTTETPSPSSTLEAPVVPPAVAPTSSPQTSDQDCHARAWPLPVPDVIGQDFSDAYLGPLFCFNVTFAQAPDGHNVLDDPVSGSSYTITEISPDPGISVPENAPITLMLTSTTGHAPAGGVPTGATAQCNDGTYSFSAQHSGSCSQHGGVSQFYS